ncbi:MAG: superoxide dismutase family protein [Nitrospiraceae bacterium]|nr:MAG: superoxide dismutase family protein [Nitrospiraceae bacterium]
MKKNVILLIALTIITFVLGGIDQVDAWGGKNIRAEAQIQGCTDQNITGKAELKERWSEEGVKLVDIHLEVNGLSDGKHAFHIHETDACQPCGEAKGHFDPGPHGFSNPDGNHPFHSGDLINIESKNGKGVMETTTSRITLSPGPLSIFDEDGSAFIIHTNMDTYCPEGIVKGCAGGSRDACGSIKMKEGKDKGSKKAY